jgi:signal peptidase I
MNSLAKQPFSVWRGLRWLVRQAERILAAFGLAALVYWTCFDYSCIVSESMAPTLLGTGFRHGDRVLTERVSYWFRQPRRWEVVAIRKDDGSQIMKRVVGLPGEKMQMLRGGRILINGEEIAPPRELNFLSYFPFGNLTAGQAEDCGSGFYVLGDFSRDSDDSRYNGPVPSEQILGRAWLILWPTERRNFVNP